MVRAKRWVYRSAAGGAVLLALVGAWRWHVLAGASRTIAEARDLLQQGRSSGAREHVSRLLWWRPREPAALQVVAESWLADGEYAKAAGIFSEMPEEIDEHRLASYREALAWLGDRQLDHAEAAFRRYFQRYHGPETARRDFGRLLFETFQMRELERLLEDFLQHMPADPWTLSSLLTSEFRPQPPRDGLAFLRSVNRRHPGQPAVERGLAYCYWQSGNMEQARQWFKTALRNDPQDTECRLMAAQFLIELQELDSAETLLAADDDHSRRLLAGDDRWWAVGSRLAQAQGDFRRALDLLEEAMRRRPHELEYVQRSAMLYDALGDRPGAEVAYVRAGDLERCRTRLLQLVVEGKVEHPTAEACQELAELCRQRGRGRQAAGWRALGERLASAVKQGGAAEALVPGKADGTMPGRLP